MTDRSSAGVEAPAAWPGIPATEPGVYYDMPAEEYHASSALSSSGARQLLPPGCPALFHHSRSHPPVATAAMDLGTAAHRLVLGDGPDLVRMDFDDWRSKAARQERDEIHAAGGLALLPHDYDTVHAMADAIRAHPLAGKLFVPNSGRPEVSLLWTDEATGVNCRARLDWLRHPVPGRRLFVPDYKTTTDASPDGCARSMATYGYHQQAAWYLDGVRALDLAPDGAEWLFVFQERTAPYLVTVTHLDADALLKGAARNRRAREIYAECTASWHWPGYAEGAVTVSLPTWASIRDEEYA